MKELKTRISDEAFHDLEQAAKGLGVSIEEILRRSVMAYLADIRSKGAFEPIGFGMWADREEMQDATKWVHELRGREWER